MIVVEAFAGDAFADSTVLASTDVLRLAIAISAVVRESLSVPESTLPPHPVPDCIVGFDDGAIAATEDILRME
jgi:hypothetical protein